MNAPSKPQQELLDLIEAKDLEEKLSAIDELEEELEEAENAFSESEKEKLKLQNEKDEIINRFVELMPDNRRAHRGLEIEELFDMYLDEVAELRGLF